MKRLALVALVCCGSPTTEPAAAPAAAPVHEMSAVIANHCVSALSKEEAKRAQATMNDLVASCDSIPHQTVSFRVVLLPGGGMEFASTGDGGSDEVPMCVVSHKLQHRVHLTAPCPVDVRLQQSN